MCHAVLTLLLHLLAFLCSQTLEGVLQHIRFPTMTTAEVAAKVSRRALLCCVVALSLFVPCSLRDLSARRDCVRLIAGEPHRAARVGANSGDFHLAGHQSGTVLFSSSCGVAFCADATFSLAWFTAFQGGKDAKPPSDLGFNTKARVGRFARADFLSRFGGLVILFWVSRKKANWFTWDRTYKHSSLQLSE